ncbi:dihydroneopterin triphosphate 2'-epimerase [Marinomonas piezotolerans]|uniref:Dihydroneopterin triphosphate 2'-epimerase n=1 Tax=Marinomonas piezotolerans TaxID=2213058 RepID=A0A370U5Y4_9GAMM|nr:dihydroneopterin triphosphate 2'-epimerase [Marinomonas piezotolerans]RDL43175.1 dihydroneopterin triphosphate 2'-epimerase [Marinomonas piezotolerans]
MPSEVAQIRIKDLRLRTYIGFNEEEKKNKQDVVINALIEYPAGQACLSDEVLDAVNYKTICKSLINHVESNRFLLLERLTAELLDICLLPEPVTFAQVEVDKPFALRFADSVSFRLAKHKP